MDTTNRFDRALRNAVGLAGECVLFGVLVTLTLAVVLTVNGDPPGFSLAVAAPLGVVLGCLRYAIRRHRRK